MMNQRVRVKDDTGMYAEVPNSASSHYANKEGFTVPSKFSEYDIGVIWNKEDDPNFPCHFMWYELEILE